MKVKELIQILQALDQEAFVVVSGYEGGVDDVDFVTEHDIALNANVDITYFGKHQVIHCDINESIYPDTEYKVVNAVWIH